jgi:hypothetical protein
LIKKPSREEKGQEKGEDPKAKSRVEDGNKSLEKVTLAKVQKIVNSQLRD